MENRREHIVVVDDDLGMNRAIENLLDAAGYRPLTFRSGEALLESGAAASAAVCPSVNAAARQASRMMTALKLVELMAQPSQSVLLNSVDSGTLANRSVGMRDSGSYYAPIGRGIHLAHGARVTRDADDAKSGAAGHSHVARRSPWCLTC